MKIAPSLLAADFSKLAEEVKDAQRLGADYLHLDVMDGHFVPNISFGPAVIKSLRTHTDLPFDIHLMIENPDLYIKEFVDAGASVITVHAEACRHLHRTLQLIKSFGIQCGVVLNPHTPLNILEYVIKEIDWVLVMSVNPGFGGQQFIPEAVDKIAALAKWRQELGLSFLIEVDGGINPGTARLVEEAGCDVAVAGSAFFNAPDRQAAIKALRG